MNDSAFPLSLRDITRTFVQGDRRLEVLRGVSLDLRPGEIVALVGQSGSGKSTLLHIAGLLEPVLILAMGVVVLLIVLAVLMPIIEINQLVR